MSVERRRDRPGGPVTRALRTGALSLVVLAGSACEQLLDVDLPSQVLVEEAFVPENVQILIDGVVADFDCAFSGAVVSGALLADEFSNASFGNTLWQVDRRDMTPASSINTGRCPIFGTGAFGALSATRWQAEELLSHLEQWTDAEVSNRTDLIGTAQAYSAYVLLLMGESMCTAALDVGPELTKNELFSLAEAKFTSAIGSAQTAGNDEILNMSRVGRARTRLNLGNLPDAAADATSVPIDFVKYATASGIDPRRENRVFVLNNRSALMTVGEVYRDFAFQGTPDPRVPVMNTGTVGQNAITLVWLQTKYPSEDSPIAIATWEEAQLIIAEAALAAGDLPSAVGIINVLHGRTNPPLPTFSSTDPAEIMDQIIYERRAELFLESHHLYDWVRYDLPLVPPPGTLFPVGGGNYGTQRCFFLPDSERDSNSNL